MKSALIAVAATALLGNAAAAGVHDRHQAFHNRRSPLEVRNDDGEVCGCTTYVTTVTGPATIVPTPEYSAPVAPSSPAAGVPSAPAGSSPSAPAYGVPSAPAGTPSAPAGSPSSPAAGVPSSPAAGVPSSPAAGVPSSSNVAGVPGSTPAPSTTPAVPSQPATPEAPAPTPVVSTYATPGTYTIPATTITVHDTTTVCGASTTSLTPGVNTYGGVTTSVVTATTITCPYATVETAESTTTSVIKTTTYTCPAGGEYTIVPPYTTSVPEGTVTHFPTPATYTPGTYTAPEQTVTITKTNDVYVCPAATPLGGTPSGSSPATAVPTSSVDGVVGSPSSTPAPVSTPAVSVGTPLASTPAASTPSSAASSTPSKGAGGFTHNGNQWAMTYTPYSADGQCREASGVMEDLKDIKSKGFTTVRLYATDCDGLQTVGDACKELGLRMIIGIYVKETGLSGSDITEQVTDIIQWGQGGMWELVDLVVVGNEAVFNGFCTASELASFITSFKSKITAAGLSLTKITTTETLNILQGTEFSALCDAIDVIGVNVQPYFNSECTADKAGDFVVSQLELAKKACPNVSDVLNLESGWPHQGSANGAASASGDEQATAIKSIIEKAGTNSVIFSYGDDSWKSSGEFGVEQYFGCASQFELVSGTLKIGGLSLSLDIGSDGIDLDLDLNL
ncbi:cell wall glucanase [Diplodia corticola]|uniref:Probable beta-glucosidase btgE n=1 Tax=Diplodia corticola TaxID=236234 RepID=A0A1J9RR50_9PEZI|nr:cell wall glucanase [Diplodia corticola]OJD30903.1 cell wall glucanase [Diplodia corticola]